MENEGELIFELDGKLNFKALLSRIEEIRNKYPNAKIHVKVH